METAECPGRAPWNHEEPPDRCSERRREAPEFTCGPTHRWDGVGTPPLAAEPLKLTGTVQG